MRKLLLGTGLLASLVAIATLTPTGGGGGGAPSGPAGGDLGGTYPNPTLAVDRVRIAGDTMTGPLTVTSVTASGVVQSATANVTGLTASRATVTDGSKNLASSATTATELGFVSGVTAAIQTQLAGKEPTQTKGSISTTTTGLTIGSGSNSTVGPNVTVNVQTATAAQPGLLSAADFTTFNGKQAAGNYITAVTGDVTASGPGSVTSTVNSVGGQTAANVAAGAVLANAATSSNTANTIVRRGSVGEFTAGTVIMTAIRTNDGVAGTPTHTFSSETTTGLFRAGASILGFTTGGTERGRFDSTGLLVTGDVRATTGNLVLNTAGNGIQVKEGSNAKMGVATLVAGTVTVSNTSVTANSRIFLTGQNSSGTAGNLTVSARTAATSFTITSSDAGDTRSVAYMIVEPSP